MSLVFYEPIENFWKEDTVKEIHNFMRKKKKNKKIAINYKNGHYFKPYKLLMGVKGEMEGEYISKIRLCH